MSQIMENELTKHQRFRARRSQQGMKLLRIWVPAPTAPGFREEAARQAAILRGAVEEKEALEFIEAVGGMEDRRT